ncbi:MAG TPA: type II toxin-antitoxin system VapC family toxin [Vicinamibacterales bacterium]|nr:type II toxin-antitoxin system VapC family toxin [Vicinamibacterales bacterium]
MNAVVDTGVVAYYLLGTEPYLDDLSRFWRGVANAAAPAIWEAELANVVWMAVRAGVFAADTGQRRLTLAARLGVRSVPVRRLWRGAMVRAARSGLAVYDMLFVELAVRERLPLATYDARLLAAFPEIARPPDLLIPG